MSGRKASYVVQRGQISGVKAEGRDYADGEKVFAVAGDIVKLAKDEAVALGDLILPVKVHAAQQSGDAAVEKLENDLKTARAELKAAQEQNKQLTETADAYEAALKTAGVDVQPILDGLKG